MSESGGLPGFSVKYRLGFGPGFRRDSLLSGEQALGRRSRVTQCREVGAGPGAGSVSLSQVSARARAQSRLAEGSQCVETGGLTVTAVWRGPAKEKDKQTETFFDLF